MYPYFGTRKQCKEVPVTFPPQIQRVHPGQESMMNPRPIAENKRYRGSGKLSGKVAIITGGDSGIGRAVAYAFAKEGADVAIVYLYECGDAEETRQRVEELGQRCLLLQGDIRDEGFCQRAVNETVRAYGKLDILVNNAAVQYLQKSILDITAEQLELTFQVNVFGMFHMTKAALPYLDRGSSIINTTSIVAYIGYAELLDYSATKGAITVFTRSLSLSLLDQGIRVNAVAPGPIWTPLIPSSFTAEGVTEFGLQVPMQRAGQPYEVAPAYVYLASDDSSYVSGQVIHVNGGMITGS